MSSSQNDNQGTARGSRLHVDWFNKYSHLFQVLTLVFDVCNILDMPIFPFVNS